MPPGYRETAPLLTVLANGQVFAKMQSLQSQELDDGPSAEMFKVWKALDMNGNGELFPFNERTVLRFRGRR